MRCATTPVISHRGLGVRDVGLPEGDEPDEAHGQGLLSLISSVFSSPLMENSL
jgi:hypothetical protein